MRLHRLTLTAFGSFGGTETVDFDDLAEPGLFLLHGPTGAGKTTILDAVSFALFARVPGVRAAGDALRSDYAASDVATEVRLEVTIGGRRYRIVRRPKQVRAKSRGEGTRERAATATLEEHVGGAWVARGAKPTEVDPFLTEQLHMGADQFHQLVMLPQGEFARFLRANAEDRRAVLEELFATHRFAEVERWLRTRADLASATVRDRDERIRRALVAIATVADLDADLERFEDDRPLGEAPAWLDAVAARLDDRAAVTRDGEGFARQRHTEAQHALESATDVAARQHRHAEAERTHATLAEAAAIQVTQRARRDAAHRAASVVPLLTQAHQIAAERQGAERELAGLRPGVAAIDGELVEAATDVLTTRLDQLDHDVRQADERVEDERRLLEAEAQVTAIDAQVDQLDDAVAGWVLERDAIPADRRNARRDLRQADRQADRADDLHRQAGLLDDRLEAARTRDRLGFEVDAARADLNELRAAELDARQRWIDRQQARLHSQAAVLAAQLVSGDACPVCGSADHPAPAAADDQVVTDRQVTTAQVAFDRAAAATEVAAEALARLEQDHAAAAAGALDQSTTDITEQQAALIADLAAAVDAAERRIQLHDHLDKLEARAATIDDQITAAHELLTDAREARGRLATDVAHDRTAVDAARGGHASLADRQAQLVAHRRVIGALVEARQALDQIVVLDDRARAAVHDEAVARGFDDAPQAADAALDDEAMHQLDDAITAHDRAEAEAAADLSRPELIEAAALDPVDLGAVRLAHDEAQRDRDRAAIAAAGATKAADDVARLRAEIDDELTGLGPAIDEAERMRRLADLASGDDRQVATRMRLSTYVLSARLEQVAAAASRRLERMSDGQFTIVTTDDPVDGRRKGGLGLRVADAWTGTVRDTSTLSGGQTFFTSLALALGVSDVVSAEAGGARIDTLFIDEGFGSLDDNTLETVMDVLDGLRAGGRAIGIVSHVADLRTRIPSQLEVVRTARGSFLQGPSARREAPISDEAAISEVA